MLKVKSVFRILSVLAVGMCANAALAVWNESISVIAGDPSALQSATVTFALPNGEKVPVTVQDDDNGTPLLVFTLPTSGPSRGTLFIDTADGKSKAYAVPERGPDASLRLDLNRGVISAPALAQTTDSDFQNHGSIRVGFHGSNLYTDSLNSVASGSATELNGLLTANGVTGIGITESNDDDAMAWGVDVGFSWQPASFSDNAALYINGSYSTADSLDGSVRGQGTLGGTNVLADQSFESDQDFYSLSIGYEHALTKDWELFGGVGWLWLDEDLSFTSELLFDGTPVTASSGSETNDEDGWMFEVGVRYYIPSSGLQRGPFSIDVRITQTDDLIRDESLTSVSASFLFGFNF